MKYYASQRFWQCFHVLPENIQQLARRNYKLLKANSSHPSLQLKPVCAGRFLSVRVGINYRALGIPVTDGIQGFGLVAMLIMTNY